MAVIDTYSKRRRARERADDPDVYQYDTVPSFLRQQISLILRAALNDRHGNRGDDKWRTLAAVMEREVEGFPGGSLPQQRCQLFVMTGAPTDDWLTFVELACRLLSRSVEKGIDTRQAYGAAQSAQDALGEVNVRFREHAFGYEFRNDEIIRIDDQFTHAEVVRPALRLLLQPGFEKANEEFMTAHRHLRNGDGKDAIVAANRAFESTLKAVCKARGWLYPDGARAAELVTALRNNGLFPTHLGNGLDAYVAMMKTGLPSVRNNAGGHGADPEAPAVPDYLAAYALHLTASNILLTLDAHGTKV